MDAQPGWKTGKRGAIISVQRALNWAAKQGHIESSPIREMEKPAQSRREQLVSHEVYRKILGKVKDEDFRDILELSWETGARPHELFTIQASYVDLQNARWVFPAQESKGKRHQRVIYLTDRAFEITRKLLLKRPNGPLLLNTDGVPWCTSAVSCRFQRIRNKLGIKYSLYAIRHTFLTTCLVNGIDAVTTSVLAGHRDTTMLARHYAHLSQKPGHLRAAANRARPTSA